MDRTLALMLVFFGGGIGCLLRYISAPNPDNPFMLANIIACLAIGSIYCLTRYKVINNIYFQSFISIGLLGGLSTFTPLATYAIVQSEPIFIASFLWFIAYMAAFLGIALIGYIPTAIYCKRVLKLQPVPSIAAIMRNKKKSRREKRREEEEKEAQSQQYSSMLKELLVAKDMLEKLKHQTAELGELAKHNPQAAREYAKAKIKIKELQKTLQIHQARITGLDPLKGLAPEGLEPAPGFDDEAQKLKERNEAKEAGRKLHDLNREEEQKQRAEDLEVVEIKDKADKDNNPIDAEAEAKEIQTRSQIKEQIKKEHLADKSESQDKQSKNAQTAATDKPKATKNNAKPKNQGKNKRKR